MPANSDTAPKQESRASLGRVFRVQGRETPLSAMLLVGHRSAPVTVLAISASGAGLFVTRDACRLLVDAARSDASCLKIRLMGIAGEGAVTFGVRVIQHRVVPKGVRMALSFVIDAGARSVLQARLRAALNERVAVRVFPPADSLVRVRILLSDGRRLSGVLRDASVMGLGLEVRSPEAPTAGCAVITWVWLDDGEPVMVRAELVRVATVSDREGDTLEGCWSLGLCFAPNGEAACPGGMAISRYVVRLQQGVSRLDG